MEVLFGQGVFKPDGVAALKFMVWFKPRVTVGFNSFAMRFLDGPEWVVVVVADKASDGLETAAPWVVDEMWVETDLLSSVLVVEHNGLDAYGGTVHEFGFADFLLDLLFCVVLDVGEGEAKKQCD